MNTPIVVYRYVMNKKVIFNEGMKPQYYEPFDQNGSSTDDDIDPFLGLQNYGGYHIANFDFETDADDVFLHRTCQAMYWEFSSCCEIIRLTQSSDPNEAIHLYPDFKIKFLLKWLEEFQTQDSWPMFQQFRNQTECLIDIVKTEIAVREGLDIKASPDFGYVYLISSTEGHYKIGMSNDPERRIKELKPPTILPIDFSLEHQIETNNMRKLETRLHHKYAAKKHKGEWYSLTPDDIKSIKTLKIVVV